MDGGAAYRNGVLAARPDFAVLISDEMGVHFPTELAGFTNQQPADERWAATPFLSVPYFRPSQ